MATYLEKRKDYRIKVLKITDKEIKAAYMVSLDLGLEGREKITDQILEYIPESMALRFGCKMENVLIKEGHDKAVIAQGFRESGYTDCGYYRFAQVECHIRGTPSPLRGRKTPKRINRFLACFSAS